MKIKVEVDLSDFYNDDSDASFNQQILDAIAYDVKGKVLTDFRNKGLESVQTKVVEYFNSDFEKEITQTVKNIFEFKAVKDGKTYKQLVEEKVAGSNYFREDRDFESAVKTFLKPIEDRQNKLISEAATKLGNELKQRYDMLFASQLVAKLGSNGMLKEDVAKVLFEPAP